MKIKIISLQQVSVQLAGQHWQFAQQCFREHIVLFCQGSVHK